jgi:hypothetical protein
MAIAVRHIDPNSKTTVGDCRAALADMRAPSKKAILQSLRKNHSNELALELLEVSRLRARDIHSEVPNEQLDRLIEKVRRNYSRGVKVAEPVIADFYQRFVEQAKTFSKTGLIPLSPDEIDRRLKRLSFELVDPIKEGVTESEYMVSRFVIRIPVPVTTGRFLYADFAHEVLHGLAGRNVVSFSTAAQDRSAPQSTIACRAGLRFQVPMPQGVNDLFEWLDEGLVEYLTVKFEPHLQKRDEAYTSEVSIIKSLIDPNGYYRVPLSTLTAAYFADFDYRKQQGSRYPEWQQLNAAFPIHQITKINYLVETFGVDKVAPLLKQMNVFTASRAELSELLASSSRSHRRGVR